MTHHKNSFTLIIAALTGLFSTSNIGAAELTETGKLNTVKVSADALTETTEQTDSYTIASMNTATKLDLSIRETPQSVSVITRTQLNDYHLTTVNEALQHTPGITVENTETDRTYYTARGFDITNFQEDGVGTPLNWSLSKGDTDTAIYDRIEVVHGANGLMSGVGNPSATINKVRKRPTADFQASVTGSLGSWNDHRLEGDVSGALTENVRGRVVLAQQDKDSYLRDYAKELAVAYGVIEADLSTNTLLTAGISHQKSDADSPMWGALTLAYSDGTPTDFAVSSNTSADWSYWNVAETKSFIELNHMFDSGWMTKATYTHTDHKDDSELFYMYGSIDPQTNSGLYGWAGKYSTDRDIDLVDIYLSGQFTLGGREHDLVVGANWAKSDSVDTEDSDFTTGNGFPDIGDFTQWRGQTPRPTFVRDPSSGANVDDKQTAVYWATHLHFTDKFSAVAGARLASFDSTGISYGTSVDASEKNKLIPYAGLTYDLNQTYTLYTSYTETFMPQAEKDADHKRLEPTEGVNTELGIKGAFFDSRLNASAAIFKAEHNNIAESLGFVAGNNVYGGFDYESRGMELELSGKVTEQLSASIGYTNLTVDNMQGDVARTYVPKQMFKLSTSYNPARLAQLNVGASAQWQGDIYRQSEPIKQDAYTLVSLFARYQLSDHLLVAFNLNNLGDEKYIESIMWDQGFYGAPRNISASLSWSY
ncbi:MAG: TonB-dependent siderophore receptor [Pseudomonadota bacterium]